MVFSSGEREIRQNQFGGNLWMFKTGVPIVSAFPYEKVRTPPVVKTKKAGEQLGAWVDGGSWGVRS